MYEISNFLVFLSICSIHFVNIYQSPTYPVSGLRKQKLLIRQGLPSQGTWIQQIKILFKKLRGIRNINILCFFKSKVFWIWDPETCLADNLLSNHYPAFLGVLWRSQGLQKGKIFVWLVCGLWPYGGKSYYQTL